VIVRALGEAGDAFRLRLQQVSERVMHDLSTLGAGRLDLDGAHPARLGHAGFDRRPRPFVLGVRGDRVWRRANHQIRGSERVGKLPAIRIGNDRRGGKSLHVALRRTGVDPPNDRGDLGVGERAIVLELLNADRLVDVPGRHLARLHAFLDDVEVLLGVVVGQKRHRRDRAGLMAHLTFALEERRDVRRVGDVFFGGRPGLDPARGEDAERAEGDRDEDGEAEAARSVMVMCHGVTVTLMNPFVQQH
jgi:hypothetical protein